VTKAGVVSFTRSFASYLGPHGIQVNAVAPGPVLNGAVIDVTDGCYLR
jgi:NAD(P)-dependent dehydrogenase (short-subunit alcohol dehydrogenase family)